MVEKITWNQRIFYYYMSSFKLFTFDNVIRVFFWWKSFPRNHMKAIILPPTFMLQSFHEKSINRHKLRPRYSFSTMRAFIAWLYTFRIRLRAGIDVNHQVMSVRVKKELLSYIIVQSVNPELVTIFYILINDTAIKAALHLCWTSLKSR